MISEMIRGERREEGVNCRIGPRDSSGAAKAATPAPPAKARGRHRSTGKDNKEFMYFFIILSSFIDVAIITNELP